MEKSRLKKVLLTVLVPIMVLCTFMACMGLFGAKNVSEVNATIGTAGWTTRGTGSVGISDAGDGFTKFTGIQAYGSGAYYNAQVPVDGLTLSFYTTNLSTAKIGLGFTDAPNGYPPQSANRFNIVLKANSDWNIAYYINNHDVDNVEGGRVFYAYENQELTDPSYGFDGNQFYGFSKTAKYGIKVHFTKISATLWQVDTALLYGNDVGRNQAYKTYVSNDCINGDSKYLTVWGMDAACDSYVKVETKSEGLDLTAHGPATMTAPYTMKTAGWGGYATSSNVFDVNNFCTTINVSSFGNEGWFMFGLTRQETGFNSFMERYTVQPKDYGMYIMFEPSADKTKVTCKVYVLRPGTGDTYFDFQCGGFETAMKNGELKIRMYPDEFNRYIQIDVNGMYLMNNRLRNTLAAELFENSKAHILLQAGCASGEYIITTTDVNNRTPSDKNVTTPDPNNIEKYTTCYHDDCTVVINTPATCTTKGEKTLTCKNCKATWTSEIPALGHTLGEWHAEVPATCENTGVKGHYECSVCHKNLDSDGKTEIADIVIPKDEHTFGNWIEGTPATCKATGIKGHFHCSVCNKDYDSDGVTLIEDLTIPMLKHEGGEPVKENEVKSTCTVAGHYEEVISCKHCGDELSRQEINTPPLGHDYQSGECSRCHQPEPAPCSHDWQETGRQEADCTHDGFITYECGKCHDVMTEELKSKGHTLSAWIDEVSPTCTSNGVKGHYHCNACNKNFDSDGVTEIADLTIPKQNHLFGAWIDEVPANCTQTGVKGHYHCPACNKDYASDGVTEITDLVIPITHNPSSPVRENEKAPSCTEDGSYDEVVYCGDCHTEISREHKTEGALGHDFHDGTCTRCGAKQSDKKPISCSSGIEGITLPIIGAVLLSVAAVIIIRRKSREK